MMVYAINPPLPNLCHGLSKFFADEVFVNENQSFLDFYNLFKDVQFIHHILGVGMNFNERKN